jgi:hypothetical protein
MTFLLHNIEMYVPNCSVHDLNTRNKLKLHTPTVNLTLRQKGVYYASIRVFNKLPKSIADLVLDMKRFIVSLEKYLIKKKLLFSGRFLK